MFLKVKFNICISYNIKLSLIKVCNLNLILISKYVNYLLIKQIFLFDIRHFSYIQFFNPIFQHLIK